MNKITENNFVEALRRKHGTAENALRALGLDAALIDDINKEVNVKTRLKSAIGALKLALDAEENGENNGNKLSAETVVKILDLFTKAGMPVDEVNELRTTLGQYCDEDLSGAGGEDQEDDPDGNPPPGGLALRLQREREETKAMDQAMRRRLQRERDQRALALDSRAAQSFAERFPEAAL